jgi:hypothetical protein
MATVLGWSNQCNPLKPGMLSIPLSIPALEMIAPYHLPKDKKW